ncbi:MAG TPA: alcohol dehydrogenase catalytic domain-containing protein [Methylococcus sp.]|nr:alcohol dehydrogenase catalytic domain-containing protein [Methylococcus sp.]
MRGLWLEEGQLAYREDLPLPKPGLSEALVRVSLSGICGTDLRLLQGYYPYRGILGHEFVGVVVEAAEPAWIGQRVVGEINLPCGDCANCRAGRPRHCGRRSVLGIRDRPGCFAEFLALPLANLHAVPDSVPDEAAVFAEPLAAALEIQEQLPVRPAERVLLIGAGRLGQLIAQSLALTGCALTVVARHPLQRRLLAARGVETIGEGSVPERRFDRVIEASGSPAGFRLARAAVRPGGVLVLKSTYRGTVEADLSGLVVDEITVVGSRCGPFPAALRLLERKAVDPTVLITAEWPLALGVEGFQRAAEPGALKVLLRP